MFSSLLRSMQRLRLPSSIKLFAIFLSIFLLVQPIVAKKFPESIILEEDDKSLDGSNSESAAIDSNQNIPDDRILNRSKPRNECEGKHNEAVKTLMEKVCELCHDFFSHHNPNTRSQCRSNCFRSRHFKKCLNLFTPSRSLRHTLHRKHQILLDED